MNVMPVRVYVEREEAVPFVQALLRPYAVEVLGDYTTSGAVSAAQGALMNNPDQPVVLLINAETADEREAATTRLSAKRLLAGVYPENWYVAVAVPYLDAWASTDPRIKRELDSLDSNADDLDRAVRMSELIKDQPFDTSELSRSNADYRGLIEYLQKHAPASATPAASVASP